jgi:AcrR family transcriptional regulator
MKDEHNKTLASDQGRVARRRARVRADLLAAARQVFTTRGYHDATIADVTQLADVATGTFYLHFQDKEELFVAVVEEGLHAMRDEIHAALRQQPDTPILALIIRTFLRTAYAQRDLFVLMSSGGPPLTQPHTQQAQAGFTRHFVPALQAAQAAGQLASMDPALLAHLLVGLLLRAVSWWRDQDEPGPEVMADQILTLLAQGMPEALAISSREASAASSADDDRER